MWRLNKTLGACVLAGIASRKFAHAPNPGISCLRPVSMSAPTGTRAGRVFCGAVALKAGGTRAGGEYATYEDEPGDQSYIYDVRENTSDLARVSSMTGAIHCAGR